MTDLFSRFPEIPAILLVVAGIVLARLASRYSDRALGGLEGMLRRFRVLHREAVDFTTLQAVVRGVVYYFTLFLFLLLALRVLGVAVVAAWLDTLLSYIPELILAAVIILSGYLLGLIARSAVAGAMGQRGDDLLPRFVQLLVMTAAVLTGLGQLAIDLSFITTLIIVFVATFLGGMSLAFALGSGQLVANVLARRGLDRYKIGSRIRVGKLEGEIIDMLDTAVVIETSEGITTIPAARFANTDVTLLNVRAEPDGEEAGEDGK